MRKKILFIIPYIPYPLDSGGNQAFFNMVEYLRHKMAVSVLLYPETGRRMQDVESLKKIWDNVDFFIYTPKTKTVRLPKIKHPFYYKWLQKIHASVTRKMNRQQIWTDETGEVVDLVRGKSTLFSSCFQPLDQGYVEYVSQVAHSGFDIIQVEFYELLSLGFLLPRIDEATGSLRSMSPCLMAVTCTLSTTITVSTAASLRAALPPGPGCSATPSARPQNGRSTSGSSMSSSRGFTLDTGSVSGCKVTGFPRKLQSLFMRRRLWETARCQICSGST